MTQGLRSRGQRASFQQSRQWLRDEEVLALSV
jgi:hypothetical protein